MFYSRPKIEPFGWDLTGVPTPNGSNNFDAETTDGRPVDFRFRGGWLSVKIGPADAPSEDRAAMKEVFRQSVALHTAMDILPEQICDLLGITINGEAVAIDREEVRRRHCPDFSGETTSWVQYCYFSESSLISFLETVEHSFNDVVFVGRKTKSNVHSQRRSNHTFLSAFKKLWRGKVAERDGCSANVAAQKEVRYINFVPAEVLSDLTKITKKNSCKICIDTLDPRKFSASLERMHQPDVPLDNILRDLFKLTLHTLVQAVGQNPLLRKRFPDIEVSECYRVSFQATYATADEAAATRVARMIELLDAHCFSDVAYFDLVTGYPEDGPGLAYCFGKDLREWCLASPLRILMMYSDSTGSGRDAWKYVGARPAEPV